MALTADQIMALNLHDYHQMILPYLNGGGMGMKLLWENSDPTQSFASGNVTLSSSDYDLLLSIALLSTADTKMVSNITPKGYGGCLFNVNSANNRIYRDFEYVSDTVLTFGAGKNVATDNNILMIPYIIYGIKVYNRDVQSDYEIIDGTIDNIGANAKKTITLSPTIPTGKKVIGWSMYTVDSDLQTYMQYYGGNYILCVKNIANSAMTNKDYRVVFIYG